MGNNEGIQLKGMITVTMNNDRLPGCRVMSNGQQ